MSTKFFNNTDSPLIDKFKGIADNMANFHTFQAVVGYFRSSGYFKLRPILKDVKKIQILVGINIDDIFRKHDKSLLMLSGEDEARTQFTDDFIKDVIDAKYSAEVEEGILQLCDDLVNGVVEMRIDKSKNLHAKFYLCLPEVHNENTDGWVLMGSSNISDSGLGITQPPHYELNVAMKDYSDVAYCKEEFSKLWEESIPITPEDIVRIRKKTYLDYMPTPYEIFIKVLIDAFGSQVEDSFSMELPEGYIDLRYQKDAVIQGYQMLKEYNGFFLADVVGTGKTIVGTMITKRFIEENGKFTNVLVVCPPALKKNWEDTIKDFSISRYVQIVSNGSLNKVIEGRENYKAPEEFDLIIVDEAHNFRSDSALKYDELQRICKTNRLNDGYVPGLRKKVMLLSATPLNNRPQDFLNLILLFQDSRNPTIDGVSNLDVAFGPWIRRYEEAMRNRNKPGNNSMAEVEKIYEEMRTEILDKILVRRTRKNLLNNEDYKADLDKQGVKFPHIEPPEECEYVMDSSLSALFYHTINILTDTRNEGNPNGKGLNYARYRAIEFLNDEAQKKFKSSFKQALQVTNQLQSIYRVHMVKRLESSFSAFKTSLHTFLRITQDMIKMFDENKILIAPDYDIKGMMAKDIEIDKIIESLVEKGNNPDDFVFESKDFKTGFLELLNDDIKKLQELCNSWDKVEDDPKLDKFISLLNSELFDRRNKEKKLVVFSESVDTLNYLNAELQRRLKREDILCVSASNRKSLRADIDKNFDANYRKGAKLNEYNIILTSDVLAEGVNLHRSNIIINYDSPWNATRLMQRIGRVNRIGSVADNIYNYMFYPSDEGDEEIKLYQNALLKLQGFHTALGEDAQIYTRQEILHEFKLFDENVRDNVDKQLELLREVRKLYATNRELYNRIKSLPVKSRTVRKAENRKEGIAPKSSIIYIKTGEKSQFYKVEGDGRPEKIEFIPAAEILRAKIDEEPGSFDAVKDIHFTHVEKSFAAYLKEEADNSSAPSLATRRVDRSTKALNTMRLLKRLFRNEAIYDGIVKLESLVQDGVYIKLTKDINRLNSRINTMTRDGSTIESHSKEISATVEELIYRYCSSNGKKKKKEDRDDEPMIVTTETFE